MSIAKWQQAMPPDFSWKWQNLQPQRYCSLLGAVPFKYERFSSASRTEEQGRRPGCGEKKCPESSRRDEEPPRLGTAREWNKQRDRTTKPRHRG